VTFKPSVKEVYSKFFRNYLIIDESVVFLNYPSDFVVSNSSFKFPKFAATASATSLIEYSYSGTRAIILATYLFSNRYQSIKTQRSGVKQNYLKGAPVPYTDRLVISF